MYDFMGASVLFMFSQTWPPYLCFYFNHHFAVCVPSVSCHGALRPGTEHSRLVNMQGKYYKTTVHVVH